MFKFVVTFKYGDSVATRKLTTCNAEIARQQAEKEFNIAFPDVKKYSVKCAQFF